LKANLLDKGLRLHSELNHSHRVVAREQTRVQVLLTELETSTGDKRLANRVNHLEPILLTETIQAIVDLFQ